MLKQYSFLFFLILLLRVDSFGQLITDHQQLNDDGATPNLSSPYHTTLTFFYNLEEDHYFPEKAARALDSKNLGDVNTKTLAVQLKQIFEGKGVIIRTSSIPNEANYTDSTTSGEYVFYFDKKILPGIFLEKK